MFFEYIVIQYYQYLHKTVTNKDFFVVNYGNRKLFYFLSSSPGMGKKGSQGRVIVKIHNTSQNWNESLVYTSLLSIYYILLATVFLSPSKKFPY